MKASKLFLILGIAVMLGGFWADDTTDAIVVAWGCLIMSALSRIEYHVERRGRE